LSAALGIRSRVEKQRTVYWFKNVRIHIDEVRALGTFIEFEAVISTPAERAAAADQLEFLSDALKINATDVLTMSYGDMVENRGAAGQLVTGGGLAGK
jgi:predicted adenylyl cyclase CyaB